MEDDLITQLAAIVGPEAVLSKYEDLVTYECDGYVIQRVRSASSDAAFTSRTFRLLHTSMICRI